MRLPAKLFSLAAAALVSTMAAACAPDDLDADDAESTGSTAAELSNTDGSRVLVYSNNVENMIFDWRDLVRFMQTRGERPDIFLVQQATNPARLGQMLNVMENALGVKYEGVIAQANPTHTRRNDDLVPKPPSTTAIIFRKARFDVLSESRWFPLGVGNEDTGTGNCGARTNDSGHEVLHVRLRDKVADKKLDAVSLRLWTRNPCPLANVRDVAARLDALGPARLQIVGGDFNENARKPDAPGFDCWYRSLVKGLDACDGAPNLRFSEPLYDACGGDKDCVRRGAGIDYLFGRHGDDSKVKTAGYGKVGDAEANRADAAKTGGDGPSNTVKRDGFKDVSGAYSTHPALYATFAY